MSIAFVQRNCCPVCASTSHIRLCDIGFDDPRLREFLARFYGDRIPPTALQGATYSVRLCDSCGCVYQDPILDDAGMLALYEDWIDHESSLARRQRRRVRLERQYRRQAKTLLRMLPAVEGRPRALDFGMGWGYWSLVAREQGIEVTGLELSPRRASHARDLGLEVIDRLPPPGDCYDIIYASQVFEHLPNPLSTLQDLVARLSPRGVIHLRVPDGRGVVDTLLWRGWIPELDAIHPLEHINCFTRATLIKLGANAGLKLMQPPLILNPASLIGGLRREFNDRFVTTHLYFRRKDPTPAIPM